MIDEPHILRVPEFFRVFLYKLLDAGVPRGHMSSFLLLREEVRRGGPGGYVNMSETWRFSEHRLKGIAAFLDYLGSGTPRGTEGQRVAATAKALANRVHNYAGTSAVDRLAQVGAQEGGSRMRCATCGRLRTECLCYP